MSTETNPGPNEVYNKLSLRCDCKAGYRRNLAGNCVLTGTKFFFLMLFNFFNFYYFFKIAKNCPANEVYNILSLRCDCRIGYSRNVSGTCVEGTKIFFNNFIKYI